MPPMSAVKWYNENVALEDGRLELGRVEKATTMHYIQQALAKTGQDDHANNPMRIADIGGGTGVYARPLAKAGHEVHYSDIASAEVEFTKQKAEAAGLSLASALTFDARDILRQSEVYKPGHYDMVLLLGPLYHILDEAEQAHVLLGAVEMLRPGGTVISAFVMRHAHLRDLATRDPGRLAKEWEFYGPYLQDGKYTRGNYADMHHTTLHEIGELVETVTDAASEKGTEVKLVKRVSCEGFLGYRKAEYLAKLDDGTFQKWIDLLLQTAEDETTLGCADHLLVIMRRL